jgi:hypothetical protein
MQVKLLGKFYKLFLLFKSRGYFALLLFFYLAALLLRGREPSGSWQKNQTQALGLRLDGFYCSNTVLGECCARQVRTYSSQAPFFVLLAQACPSSQRHSPHVVIYVTPPSKQWYFSNYIIIYNILYSVVKIAIQNLLT